MGRDYSHRNFKDKTFQPLALGLGQAALAWNDLLISLSGLFGTILKIPNQLIPNTVWYTVTSDRDQIKVLRNLAASKAIGVDIPKGIREEIDWVCGKAINLVDVRNDLLHSPFTNSFGALSPLHLGVHPRAIKYTDNHEVMTDCDWFYGAATKLRDRADCLDDALTDPNYVLPDKPEWTKRPSRKA